MPAQTVRKTQVYLPESLYRYLRARAAAEGVSMAEIIRRLLQESARTTGRLDDDPFLALGRPGTQTGVPDGASRHDDYLYGPER